MSEVSTFIGEKHLQAEGGHTAEERLQSYVIRHTSEHLAKKGRRIIGWDEILEVDSRRVPR